jgi:hypothetical protein
MRLHASRFGLADQKRNVWHAVLPAETDYQAVFSPDYWAHVSQKMRPGDEIILLNDEMTLRAHLVVKRAGHLFAQVVEIDCVSLTDAPASGEPETTDYQVQVAWAGPHDKFRVERIRGGKKEVLARGMDKDAADKWAADHLKTISKAA